VLFARRSKPRKDKEQRIVFVQLRYELLDIVSSTTTARILTQSLKQRSKQGCVRCTISPDFFNSPLSHVRAARSERWGVVVAGRLAVMEIALRITYADSFKTLNFKKTMVSLAFWLW
jgi:hypothetical protein